ncbi:MAG: methyltransferase domain-containing protein, partial [Myxococcales bacterium]|nr:methyltransferase domain-containing protein [Myxococcales bacterium]
QKVGRAVSDWIDLEWSLVRESLRYAAPRARGRLLDVGCGDKQHEAIFLPYVDSYLGVEHSASYAATNAADRPVKADVLYDGKRLPFDNGSFDTVLSVQVLEHTPHPAELVLEMGRVLRDGGRLIMTVPFSFRLHEEPHDYMRFSPHILREFCERAGLMVEEIVPRGSLWSLVAHKLNSYLGLRVARMAGAAQMLGKHKHEASTRQGARLWTLPAVAPAMLGLAFWGRVLDRLLPDPTEALGFLVIARRSGATAAS